MKRLLFLCAIAGTFLIPGLLRAEDAVYSGTYSAPYCPSGRTPCIVPEAFTGGRDTHPTYPEPFVYRPNTMYDICGDGTGTTAATYIQSFRVTSPAGWTAFAVGDNVTVTAYVNCTSINDTLRVYYSPTVSNPPSWGTQVGSAACTGATGLTNLPVTFALPATTGYIGIRTAFGTSIGTAACAGVTTSNYDRDDLVLYVSPDTDADGLVDVLETAWGTLANDPDTDNDGLCDGNKTVAGTCVSGEDTDLDGVPDAAETNPLLADTDSDGMPDGWERTYGLNPRANDASLDPDADSLNNLGEYQNSCLPNDNDTDNDTIKDGYEVTYTCMDPLVNDAALDYDSDTLTNVHEFSHSSNPCSTDGDGDALPDVWEHAYGLNMMFYNPNEDPDGDSVTNLSEYQNSTSPIDADTDDDLMNDGWEISNTCMDPLVSDAGTDYDTDAFTNYNEFTHTTNPCLADTDGDGMPDGWEHTYGLDMKSNDAGLDPDGDSVTNLSEYQHGCNPISADTDSDEMPDGWEITYGLNPAFDDAFLDLDGDGLENWSEWNYATYPNDSDTDNDGMPDGWEVDNIFDPLLASDGTRDLDNDELLNFQEYANGTNPRIADTDGDTMPDGWEVDQGCLSPTSGDSLGDYDADTISNGAEWRVRSNPCSTDSDADAMPDSWEYGYRSCGINLSNPDNLLDSDGDLVVNGEERTLGTNPCVIQDADGDGMSDRFETTYGLSNGNSLDRMLDSDGDGLTNWEEFLFRSSPLAADTDGDSLSDYDEVYLYLTDPASADTDGDGLPDDWEVAQGTDPFVDDAWDDPDNDGLTDLEEYELELDPYAFDLDMDGDGLMNAVETGTGTYVAPSDTGTDEANPDTDMGGEWDGLEVQVNHSPLNSADDRLWSTPTLLAEGQIGQFVLAQTRNGYLHALWEQDEAGNGFTNLYYSNNSAGTWSAPYLVTGHTVDGIDMIANGDTLQAAWRDGTDWEGQIYYQSRSAAGAWSGSIGVSLIGDSGEDIVKLALKSSGVLYFFYGVNGGDTILYSSYNIHTATWAERDVQFSHPVIGYSYGPERDSFDLAVDSGDTVHIVYTCENEICYSHQKDGDSFWHDPVIVSEGTAGASAGYPQIRMDSNDQPHVIWQDSGFFDGEYSFQVFYRTTAGFYYYWGPTTQLGDQAFPLTLGDGLFWDLAIDRLDNVLFASIHGFSGLARWGLTGAVRYQPSYVTRAVQLFPDRDGNRLHLLYFKVPADGVKQFYCTSLLYPDTDSDTVNDLQEFLLGTDPNDTDTDNDGLTDGNELFKWMTDPLDTDSDGDLLDDGEETMTYAPFNCLGDNCASTGCVLKTHTDGHHYLYCSSAASWANARLSCQAKGGDLVSLGSSAENSWVVANRGTQTNSWIAFNDQASEGNWEWANGEPTLYTNWYMTEPNSGPTYNCAYYYSTYTTWRDYSCATSRAYVCEEIHPDPALRDTDGGGEDDGLEMFTGKNPAAPLDDNGFSSTTTVSDDPVGPSAFNDINITVNTNGQICIIYSDRTAPYQLMRTYSSNGGASWTDPPTAFYTNPTDAMYELDAKYISDIEIMVVWEEVGSVAAAVLPTLGSLGPKTTLQTGMNQINEIELAVIGSSSVLAVWEARATEAGQYNIYFAAWTQAGGWTAVQSLPAGPLSVASPRLFVVGSTVHMAYVDANDPLGQDRVAIMYRIWNGTTWGAAETAWITGDNTLAWPNLWVSENGDRHILANALSYLDGKIKPVYLKYSGGTWAPPSFIAEEMVDGSMVGVISVNLAETGPGVLHTFVLDMMASDSYRVSRFGPAWTEPIPFFENVWSMEEEIAVDCHKTIHSATVNHQTGLGYFLKYRAYRYPDYDGDGIPDDGEFYMGTDLEQADRDGDGLTDSEELLEHGTDPNSYDSDGDRLSDSEEIAIGTDPWLYDTDGDGMPDEWEFARGLDPRTANAGADPDGDGLTNAVEFKYNLNPLVSEPLPSSTASSPAYVNAATIPVSFNCSTTLATVKLYMSFGGLPFIDMSGFGYAKSCAATPLSFSFSPFWGDGTYRFYTIATLSPARVESPPGAPGYDSQTIVDHAKPISLASAEDFVPNDPFPVSFQCDDVGASTSLFYRKNGGGFANSGLAPIIGAAGSFNFTPTGDGTYDFYTIATDAAGNVEDAPTFPSDHDQTTVVDSSPPVIDTMVVTDEGTYTKLNDRLHATWTAASDTVSPIVRYDYAIGTAGGSTDLVAWNSVDGDTAVTRYGLPLAEATTYFIGVRAVNGAGLISAPVWSNGIMLDSTPPAIVSSSPVHRDVLNDFEPLVLQPVSIRLGDLGSGISWPSVTAVLDFDTITYNQSGSTISFTSGGLEFGNHVVNVQASDLAGNSLFANIIFVLEDPDRVIINPVRAEWSQDDGPITFTADGGTGDYVWAATGGALSDIVGSTVTFTPNGAAGAWMVAVSDSYLVSAEAAVTVRGAVSVSPAVVRLNPGDTVSLEAAGGSGPFIWTATGGSCSLSGARSQNCLFTAGGGEGDFTLTATAGPDSFTAQVVVVGSVGRAIIVVGGGLVDSNRQVDSLNAMGNLAYETLLARGFSKQQILYLNPDATQMYDGDRDGRRDDIDGEPSAGALEDAIVTWGSTDRGLYDPPVGPTVPLVIYLVDHGSVNNFLINKFPPNSEETVSASQLDGWLDTLQTATGAKVVLIYDACFSGSFLDELAGPNRIVVSSANASESAYFTVNGTVSFSQFLWQNLRQGRSLWESFSAARSALASWSGQTPLLDDNGDGTFTEPGGDGAAAGSFYLGASFVLGSPAPELLTCEDVQLQAGHSADIWAEVTQAPTDKIASVFAIISPPGYSPPMSDGNFDTPWLDGPDGKPLPKVHLKYEPLTGRWEHTFTPGEIQRIFKVNGRYTATVYAIHTKGQVSIRSEFALIIFGPDAYEPDDSFATGSTIEVGAAAAQAHNFHQLADSDYVRFVATEGCPFQISTSNLAANSDTVLELYDESYQLLMIDYDSGPDGASLIWIDLDPGTYYVRAYNYDPLTFGEKTEYDLRVDQNCLPGCGAIEGFVTDSVSGFGVFGAQVKMTPTSPGGLPTTITTGVGGYYIFNCLAPGGYTLLVRRSNYNDYTAGVTILDGQRILRNVSLVAKTGTGILSGLVRDQGVPMAGVRLTISGIPLVSSFDGSYSVRLLAGSNHTLMAQATNYNDFPDSGIIVTAGLTTTLNVDMVATDTDGDGLRNTMETGCTSPTNPDTDGDGLNDGVEDANHNGVVDSGESNPCDADSDDDGHNDGADCNPLNARTWDTCATCVDGDADTWFGVCNNYTGINGPECDDFNPAVHPGATETCNGIDDNCIGGIDEGVKLTFYRDADTDTYGLLSGTTLACTAPGGYVSNSTDCNDGNAAVHPGVTEICNGIDDNCVGGIDEGVKNTYYIDADSDTYGLLSGTTLACAAPGGYVSNSTDCNDGNSAVHPGATETCNGIDDNCVGGIDEGCPVSNWDTDLDGIPDTYEIAHNSGPMPLDYLNGADGLLDSDTDGNPNVHEYWNGTDYRVKDPKGGEGCYYWGDATGDGFIGAVDITILTSRIKGPADYSRVIPNNGETQDLDDNGFWGAVDTTLLSAFAKSDSTTGIATRPSAIEKLSAATASVQVGNTTHVTVALRNLHSTYTVGFGVVFSIDPSSTGTAVILGGDGANGSGYRYDMTGAKSISARSNVIILVKTAGTIKINAGIPQCGMLTDIGRYCSALSMAEPFVITGY